MAKETALNWPVVRPDTFLSTEIFPKQLVRAKARIIKRLVLIKHPSPGDTARLFPRYLFDHQNYPVGKAAISAAIGMVRTQAQTMRPATPHLTAEKRLAEPTPTIEPVMVCVVETGMPKDVAQEKRDGSGRFGAESADGLQLDDLGAHRFDDPPAAREGSQADRGVRREDDPKRDVGQLAARRPFAGNPPATRTIVMIPIVF